MCGICGVLETSSIPDAELVQQMMGALSHRGPDGSGYYRDERVALGHTRLAIVDTVHGVQPMSNEDGQVWVTFNGEIFNHVELRTQLCDRGHEFRTHCDTEVIVHAWEEWGEACVERFRGMFAFGLWDRNKKTLFLARDRMGVKPLFYALLDDGQLIFGSVLKVLTAHPLSL